MNYNLSSLLAVEWGTSPTINYRAPLLGVSSLQSASERDCVLTVQPYWILEALAVERECHLQVLPLAQNIIQHLEDGNIQSVCRGFTTYCLMIPTFRSWRCFQECVHFSVASSSTAGKAEDQIRTIADYVYDLKRVVGRLHILHPEGCKLLQEVADEDWKLPLPSSAPWLVQLLVGLRYFALFYEATCFQRIDENALQEFVLTCPEILRHCHVYNELLCKACIELNLIPQAFHFLKLVLLHLDFPTLKEPGTLPLMLPTSLLVPYTHLHMNVLTERTGKLEFPYDWSVMSLRRMTTFIKKYLGFWVVRGEEILDGWTSLVISAYLSQAELWVAYVLALTSAIPVERLRTTASNCNDYLSLSTYANQTSSESGTTLTSQSVSQSQTEFLIAQIRQLLLSEQAAFYHAVQLAEDQRRVDLLLNLGGLLLEDDKKTRNASSTKAPASNYFTTSLSEYSNRGWWRIRRTIELCGEAGVLWRYVHAYGLILLWEGDYPAALQCFTTSACKQRSARTLTVLGITLLSVISNAEKSVSFGIRQGVFLLANRYLEKAYNLSYSPGIGFLFTYSCFYLQRFSCCIRVITNVLTRLPTEVELRYIKALCHLKLGSVLACDAANEHWVSALFDLRVCCVLIRHALMSSNTALSMTEAASEATLISVYGSSREGDHETDRVLTNATAKEKHDGTLHIRLIKRRLDQLTSCVRYLEKRRRCIDIEFRPENYSLLEASKTQDLAWAPSLTSQWLAGLFSTVGSGQASETLPKLSLSASSTAPATMGAIGAISTAPEVLYMPPAPLLFTGSSSNIWAFFLFGDNSLTSSTKCSGDTVLSPENDKLIFAHLCKHQREQESSSRPEEKWDPLSSSLEPPSVYPFDVSNASCGPETRVPDYTNF